MNINRVQEAREYYGLSQRELAKATDISSSMLNYIESGKRTPTVYTAIRIAKALKTTVEELFIEGEKEND